MREGTHQLVKSCREHKERRDRWRKQERIGRRRR
ncbi:hypothetical protein C366_06660 [Cryptococcus neoformans Tu401-1]|nr:hypothetical protein C366_06660 [Cryptococcus neoformans var. grubii Tu401-1]